MVHHVSNEKKKKEFSGNIFIYIKTGYLHFSR